MSANPTPGPWLFDAGTRRVLGPPRPRQGRLIVCTGLYPSQDADGFLIAAAPELLEALKACAAVCSGETTTKSGLIAALESARAAIRKATTGKQA